MSAAPPILILQMQRMGDLILSFPLALWLLRRFPGHPIWLVGEEIFFKGLLPIAPDITFFPTEALHRLHGNNFHLVLNLSHRPEAAELRRHIHCDAWFGPYTLDNGETHIGGNWQLYRASLTHNNRHNLFHWSDLNALDIIPYKQWRDMSWQQAKEVSPRGDRVGLFLGASEAEKRPEAPFWAELARRLLKLGLSPVLLGGQGERPLGNEVARLAGVPALNLCGRFDLPGLVSFMDNLRLLVTPDTGPMHLAAWLGLPVLNLSLGPVNAWETGPYQPGHLILRSTISCEGCWQCTRPGTPCRESFSAARTASIIKMILEPKGHERAPDAALSPHATSAPPPTPAPIHTWGHSPSQERLAGLRLPGQEIFISGRHGGLYNLISPSDLQAETRLQQRTPAHPQRPRLILDYFWQAFFAHNFNFWEKPALLASRAELIRVLPQLFAPLEKSLARQLLTLARSAKQGGVPLAQDFWQEAPPLLRPLTGYTQMLLQNENYSPKAYATAMELAESLKDILKA